MAQTKSDMASNGRGPGLTGKTQAWNAKIPIAKSAVVEEIFPVPFCAKLKDTLVEGNQQREEEGFLEWCGQGREVEDDRSGVWNVASPC